MSRNPLLPPKPTAITLSTLPELFAHNRARFGGFTMTQTLPEPPPAGTSPADQPLDRPTDIAETEWDALGDPGKRAIVRERGRADAAERALAASRARPATPTPPPPKPGDPPKPTGAKPSDDQPDIAAIIRDAVSEAVKPFQEAEQRRQTTEAAQLVQKAVTDAAKDRLHDATDALTGIDLVGVVNDQGQADPVKVKAAIDDLVKRKPHLAKTAERFAPPGIGGGAPAGATDADKVKAVLADMQRATGVRPPAAVNGTTN